MRKPSARAGELHMYYGKLDRWSAPDVIYHSGEGVPHCDQRLLHYALGCERMEFAYGEEQPAQGLPIKFAKSFIHELEERGYDLTTLRFSIRKKPTPTPPTSEGEK